MDLTPIIFIALFLLASFLLFFVYKYSTKEKSYEEAIAEQRQQTNVLLGTRPKPKEKKNKKASKKSKEKATLQGNETDESENVENVAAENAPGSKLHVEFKEEPEEMPIKEVVHVKMKRTKKVRPILVRKDKSPEKVILDVVETPVANHFEENPPKDEFELLRSNSRDDIFKHEPVKEKTAREKRQTVDAEKKQNHEAEKKQNDVVPTGKNKKSSKHNVANSNTIVTEVTQIVVEKEVEKKIVESTAVAPQTNGIVGNPGKEKKKKKSEFNTRQQLTAERDGLLNSVRKAELTKNEVQNLIDLLLNKQLEAPNVIDDWSEGKSDPVQKLKRQLAEKEKALAEEQEALVGVQAKLKEIRAEQQAEKSQLQAKIRGLEEVIQAKQIELQASNNRTQVNTQKLQQLQGELNAEILKTHKLVEENQALQAQAQQVDVRVAQLQETDTLLAKLKGEIDELSVENQQLRLELQQSLGEKDHQQQHFLIQMGNLEKGLKQQIQQLEESHQELERNLEIALRQEDDWKIEISNLNTALQQQFEEKRLLEHNIEQLREELVAANSEKTESGNIVAQLQAELRQLKEEKTAQVNGSSEENKAQEVRILNLTNELSSVRSELATAKTEAQQVEKRYKTELEASASKFVNFERELQEQKGKNNELRTKNWKVMEALNAAESRSKASSATKQTEVNVDKLASEIRSKEQEAQKQFIQRLFPEIEKLQAVTAEDWQAEFGKLIKSYVADLRTQQKAAPAPASPDKSQEIAKLEAQILHYKNIIDDTEGTLNKLQSHIEKEEINWRGQLAAKEAELESVREKHVSPKTILDSAQYSPDVQGVRFAYECIEKSLPVIIDELQTQVTNLEQQLSREVSEKQQISKEYQLMGGQKPQAAPQPDATATIERLSEEVSRLREQLRVEQTKNGDVSVCLKAQSSCNNTNSTNGPAFVERCLSSSSSLASSVIEEINKKPKSKKKKKKETKN